MFYYTTKGEAVKIETECYCMRCGDKHKDIRTQEEKIRDAGLEIERRHDILMEIADRPIELPAPIEWSC